MPSLPRRPRGLLIDLDGTLCEAGRPLPGAADAVARLRALMPLRFVTNTTRAPRRAIVESLRGLGIDIGIDELFTAPLAAAAWLRQQRVRRVALCLPAHTAEDFREFDLVDVDPEAVLVGDLGEEWTFARVNQAFRWLAAGAALVALHRNRFWKTAGGLTVDAGAYVAALEYAANVEATIVGKPAAAMFHAAAASMGFRADEVAMVGDDLVSDVDGARAAGALGVLVRTGKFTPDQLDRAESPPDLVVDSIGDLSDAVAASR